MTQREDGVGGGGGAVGVLFILLLIQNPSIHLSASMVTENDPSRVMKVLAFISHVIQLKIIPWSSLEYLNNKSQYLYKGFQNKSVIS